MPLHDHIRVDEKSAGQRLDQFLNERYPEHTRSYFTKHIKDGSILVNGQSEKPGYRLNADDHITIEIEGRPLDLTPAPEIDVDIIYEDDVIIVVNKPAGLTVHPGKGSDGNTLVNALLAHTSKLARQQNIERPGIVHRLDKNTSGLLVVARTEKAMAHLRAQFDKKTISREYSALSWGVPSEKKGTVHTHINRSRKDPTRMAVARTGKEAITHYSVSRDYGFFALLELRLETGRTHQIRVHMSHLGYPLLGDPDYNGRDKQLARLPQNLRKRGQHLLKMLPYQFLHAQRLSFIHPLSEQNVQFESVLPETLQNVLDKLPDLFLMEE